MRSSGHPSRTPSVTPRAASLTESEIMLSTVAPQSTLKNLPNPLHNGRVPERQAQGFVLMCDGGAEEEGEAQPSSSRAMVAQGLPRDP